MARPSRFTPEQLAQMAATQQSIQPTGLGGNQNYMADDDMWGGESMPQAPNPSGALMGGTGWQRDPNSASTFGNNDENGGAIPTASNAQEPQGWMDREVFPGSKQVEGYGSGPLTGKGALAAAGVAALGAYLVNRNRKKKGKQKVSQILATRL